MLAYELKKDVEDILRMDPGEFTTWLAFFKVVNDARAPKPTKRQNAGKG